MCHTTRIPQIWLLQTQIALSLVYHEDINKVAFIYCNLRHTGSPWFLRYCLVLVARICWHNAIGWSFEVFLMEVCKLWASSLLNQLATEDREFSFNQICK